MSRLLARLSRTSRPLQSLAALSTALALSACVVPPTPARYAASLNGPVASAPTTTRVAILLPLTGANAEIGQAMLKAAQLSFDAPGSPTLDQQDTASTPEGAANAARAALAAGAGIIIGPLTAPETTAAAPIARAAGIPMLAFTSDATLAQPGIWTLGITPAQQIRRLVLAVQAENKTRLAAVLPQNPFGDALAAGLTDAARSANLPAPQIRRTPGTVAGLNIALKDVSDYAARHPGAPDPKPTATPPEPSTQSPPMDALLLGVSGSQLGQAVRMLTLYDIAPNQVRILGPATWIRDAANQPALAGAWYAAPDPGPRATFEQRYTAKYNAPARDFTSLAYDAAGIARATATPTGYPLQALTRPEGYAGADGLIALQPDGQVRRGLAIFEVDRTGAHIVQPTPQSLTAPRV